MAAGRGDDAHRRRAHRRCAFRSEPFILLTKLGDFSVSYELNVYVRDTEMIGKRYAELHRHIIDVFNEYQVQIMTPAYEGDPEQPKVVPPEHWYSAPASPDVRPKP
ncbi:hypothetical protein [Achromobacter mucicolens]|uniref:hypothetical protein n=1 Tax=Achromobacter mucicolens TaxID=1389922 RepID=UPI003976A2E6